jgi:sugar phosphate isomerase/epimerase
MSDDEVDFAFRLAKALGARAISTEIARPDISQTRRIGQFADRHGIMVGYHGHTETGPADWETAFSYARHNGANLDIGHYVAGHNTSPVPFLKAHHDRITHIHVKDRRLGTKGGDNVPFGQGDTPIGEILRLIRDNRWNIQATIEFEYPVPDGSDRMAEMRKCIEFCRTQLQT